MDNTRIAIACTASLMLISMYRMTRNEPIKRNEPIPIEPIPIEPIPIEPIPIEPIEMVQMVQMVQMVHPWCLLIYLDDKKKLF